MYKPPITIDQKLMNNFNDLFKGFSDFYDKANAELEKEVVCRVRMETKINIDKDELFKALRYDRAQYDKGYADGHKDGYDKGLREAVERLKKTVEYMDKYEILMRGKTNERSTEREI